jgi:hypothetical protein
MVVFPSSGRVRAVENRNPDLKRSSVMLRTGFDYFFNVPFALATGNNVG